MEFTKGSCEAFVEVLASKAPVPGGGGASSLVGAIGTALGNMVGSLTLGKKKYADVQDDIIALKAKADALQAELLDLVQKDAEMFEPLSKAYGLPKETEEEKAEKARIMEAALKDACSVPLLIMEKCCEAIELHKEFAAKGSALAISDVGVGVACCRAALLGASLNVFINTKSMTDKAYAAEINEKAEGMISKYVAMADEIFADVRARF
ncbi:cyclodeaminase/cyclohydrolase family protein [Hominifimenecus sp. rT4P-3]|uniref:cyclodeaminase/cyclohydrolase family protein n=1 Tax=Hominifimenecus sp. rT4P-3 TaxID=3242979 RepID=UPI003DA37E69